MRFFFDLDGTLAEIRSHPDRVTISPYVIEALKKIRLLAQGAVALVSGRPIAELDRLTWPLRFACAGVHGAERRDINGHLTRVMLPPEQQREIGQRLTAAAALLPGVMLEYKPSAYALHYRAAPNQHQAVTELARQMVADYPALALQPGKYVAELRPAAVSKGMAIDAFLAELPFKGRQPLFIGDDLTDEVAFDTVNRAGGISIKVGEGDTQARYRLADVFAVRTWLISLAEKDKLTTVSPHRGRL